MKQHPTKMEFEAWAQHVEQCANTITKKLINLKEVEFAWSDRYLAHEPMATVIDALVAAGMDQVIRAIGEHSNQELAVYVRDAA